MEKFYFCPYNWHIDENQKNVTSIQIYGIDQKGKNICVRCQNFTPFCYLELPTNIEWNDNSAQMLGNKLDIILGERTPLQKSLCMKKRLYYAHIDKNKGRKLFPYLFCKFSHHSDIKNMRWKISRPIHVLGVGKIILKIHEHNATPILQWMCHRNLPPAGWIKGVGKLVKKDNITICDKEYKVKWKHLYPALKIKQVSRPLILSFDIEVNSNNPAVMPKSSNPQDVVFQISCVLYRHGDINSMQKFILTLGDPCPKITGVDVNILKFECEGDLLVGYSKFIRKYNPNIIIGYNILGFDIPYMIERSKLTFSFNDFSLQGFDNTCAEEKNINWSSSAYGQQTFQFLDARGRLYVDLLPLVKRDYKLNNYKLKTVSTHFIGATKDPLTPQGIFKCYREGMKNKNGIYRKKAKQAMGIVSKYCVQDSVLVMSLFNKLQIWVGLCEMANVCNVPIFYLYASGQQIRVFSTIYKYCMYKNYIVEKDGYIPREDEHFIGATVFQPIPGVYDRVLPFDFKSLYPTTIIAYNIDYSTLVIDDSVPDEDCHVMVWEDHCGCKCGKDKIKRKTKPKYIMCCKRKFRFLKKPMGVMPTVLKDLLEARARTRKQMKILGKEKKGTKLSEEELNLVKDVSTEQKENLKVFLEVLDQRQKAYKICANSMYGSMGVTRGYLPFMPGAMATTAMGRKNITIVSKVIPEKYGGELIYGDTDSNYIVFPHLKTSEENWDYAIKVAREVTKLFPKPIELEFEYQIYWRFFILTKKRYMYRKCGRDGVLDNEVGKKGVLLARRDNSQFIKDVYAETIMKIFSRVPRKEILYYIIDEINKLCSSSYNYKKFIVTKSIKSCESERGGNYRNEVDAKSGVVAFRNDKNQLKGKMGNYTVPLLSEEIKERKRQFKLKKCSDAETYYIRCLPGVVQLAEKMKSRGRRVDPGTRVEYVITTQGGLNGKQYEKIEDLDYFAKYNSILRIDYLYYLKLMSNPFDDVLNILYLDKKHRFIFKKNFVLNQHKYRSKQRIKLHKELLALFDTNIKFI